MPNPVPFPEANKILHKPTGMSTDTNCEPLPIYYGNKTCMSKWKLSWWERLRLMFHGTLWLCVYTGSVATQPPVMIVAERNVFK